VVIDIVLQKILIGKGILYMPDTKRFEPWLVLKYGGRRDYHELLSVMRFVRPSILVTSWAVEMFENLLLPRTEVEQSLVKVLISELGFSKHATYAAVIRQADRVGLKLCHESVGPELRVQYVDPPKNEYLHVAMIPIETSDGVNRGFCLYEEPANLRLAINGYPARGDRLFSPDALFLFALPNVKK
jgi:hypothetical protein